MVTVPDAVTDNGNTKNSNNSVKRCVCAESPELFAELVSFHSFHLLGPTIPYGQRPPTCIVQHGMVANVVFQPLVFSFSVHWMALVGSVRSRYNSVKTLECMPLRERM